MNIVKISEWLTNKYLDWQKNEGGRRTIVQFAEWLDVPQTTVSSWLNGKAVPGGSKLIKLADKFGPEIYQLLGVDTPYNELPFLDRQILNLYHRLSPEAQRRFLERLESEQNGESQLPAGADLKTKPA